MIDLEKILTADEAAYFTRLCSVEHGNNNALSDREGRKLLAERDVLLDLLALVDIWHGGHGRCAYCGELVSGGELWANGSHADDCFITSISNILEKAGRSKS